MKQVRLFQRHGWNPAGAEIELTDIQAQWMVNNGHAEFVGKGEKSDTTPRALNAGPETEATTDGALEIMPSPSVFIVEDEDPVKVVDTSPEPEKPASDVAKAEPKRRGRPRKSD